MERTILIAVLLFLTSGCMPVLLNTPREVHSNQLVNEVSVKDKKTKGAIVLIRKDQDQFKSIPVIIYSNEKKIGVIASKGVFRWQTDSVANTIKGTYGKIKNCSLWDDECIKSQKEIFDVWREGDEDVRQIKFYMDSPGTRYFLLKIDTFKKDKIIEIDNVEAVNLIKKYLLK